VAIRINHHDAARNINMNSNSMKTLMTIAMLICVITSWSTAQTTSDLNRALQQRVVGIGKRYQDSVVLRWTPSLARLWQQSKSSGYRIERAVLRDGAAGEYRILTPSLILPWTEAQWEAYATANPSIDFTTNAPLTMAALLSQPQQDGDNATLNDPGQLDTLRERRNQAEMTYSMALLAAERSRDAATGLGMRFVDKTVERGVAYRYRIVLLGDTKPYTVAPAVVDLDAATTKPNLEGLGLSVDNFDSSVLIKWTNATGHSTFDVYRSTDGVEFTKLTETPMLTLHSGGVSATNNYLDTALTNYTTYTYKIVGNNAFAEEEVLGLITATPRDLTPPAMPTDVRAMHVGTNDVELSWSMTEPVASDLAGFLIARDTAVDGSFTNVLTASPLGKNARSYRDPNVVLGGTYYYQVLAVDTARNILRSYPAYVAFADSVSPAPGILVRGSMDTNGVVRIVVKHPSDRDFMGYRLLHANDSLHEFTVRRELFHEDSVYDRSDTIIIDTAEVRTLTKYVYYQVVALDYHFNESAISNTLAIPRPDLIPPVAPVISDYSVTDSAIILNVIPSSSRDVRNHVVMRRPLAASDPESVRWDSLGSLGRMDSIYADRSSALSRTYQYAVIARDSAGNTSPRSNIVSIKRVDNMIRPTVSDLAAVYDSTSKTVELRWSYQPLDEPHSFVIYRATASGLQMYALVKDATARVYTDSRGAAQGNIYAIKVVCPSGAESKLSDPAQVQASR